jgi:predicted DNA-binding transcriptional regulator AlpA
MVEQNGRLIPARAIRERQSISDMTLYRRERDKSLNFPKPIVINGRRFWRESEILAWEQGFTRNAPMARSPASEAC